MAIADDFESFRGGSAAPSISDDFESFRTKPLPPRRTPLAVANDAVIEAGNAVAGFVGSVANFASPGNALSQGLDIAIKEGEEKQSDYTKARKATLRRELAASQGVGEEVAAVGRHLIDAPDLAVAQAAGSFAGPGGAIKAGQGIARVAGMGAPAVARAGLAGGAVAGGAAAGGDAAGNAYDLIMNADEAQLQRSAEWQDLALRNYSPRQIREELAERAARDASIVPALIGAAAGTLGAEKAVAVGRAGGRLATAGRTAVSEGAQEAFEEGATELSGRAAASQYDQSIDPTKGVAAAATMGGALGAGTGAAAGALSPRRPTNAEQAAVATQQLAEAPDVDSAIQAANALSGDVATMAQAVDEYLGVSAAMPAPAAPAAAPAQQPVGGPPNIPAERAAIDRQAELQAQAAAAPTAFDQQNALDQAAAARGTPQPGPAATYADLAPMDERQAQNRLTVLRDFAAQEGGNALALQIVPHPSQPGRFAIQEKPQELPSLDVPAPAAPQVSPDEAQSRIEAAALAGKDAERRAADAPRQDMISRAMQAIEERGGVASPYEAQVLREANLGQPYDRVDETLGRPAISDDQQLANTSGIALVKPARSTQVQGQQEAATAELTAENAARQEAQTRANERGMADFEAFRNTRQQYAAVGEQAQRDASARPPVPPAVSSVIAAMKVPPFMRSLAQKATLDTAKSRYNAEDMAIMTSAAQGAPDTVGLARLQEQEGERGSTQRVDPASLPRRTEAEASGLQGLTREMHGLVTQLGRVYGKRVEVYEDPNDNRDGFVRASEPDTIYLNRNSSVPHLVVFGHELLHNLKREAPDAYAALDAVVKQQLKPGAEQEFAKDYGSEADTEELTADLVGNRMREPEFWEGVFNNLDNGQQTAGAVARLGAAVIRAVNTAKRILAKAPGFRTDKLVQDLEAIKRAAQKAMSQYAAQRKIPAMQMAAESVRSGAATRREAPPAAEQAAAPAPAPRKEFDEEEELRAATAQASRQDERKSTKRPAVEVEELDDVDMSIFDNDTTQNNASGESAASLEAQSRVAEEREKGRTRLLVERDGTVRPLSGVDSVDQRARPGQVILQRGVGRDEWTVLEAGPGVTGSMQARAIDAAQRRGSERASTARKPWMADEPGKMDDLIRTLQDKQIDTKRVVAAIRKQSGDIAEQWDPYLQEELYHGRAAKQAKDFLDFELRPLLTDAQARGISVDELEKYLWNRHAQERNEQIAAINPDMPDGGSGLKTADAQAYLNGLSADKRRGLEALARRVDAINKKTTELLVTSGLEKQETVANWQDKYKAYVPLQREDFEEDGNTGTGQGFSIRGSAVKRAMGSEKAVANILANIASMRERTITRAEKNRVATALYGLAIQAPNKDFWTVFAPERQKKGAKIESELQSMGLSAADATAVANEPTQRYVDPRTGLVSQRANPLLRSRDNVLGLKINGEDRFVLFNERNERAASMAAALKNLDADQLGRVLGIMQHISRWFAKVNTQWNPVFGVVNLIRDTGGALFNLSTTKIAGAQGRVLRGTGSALLGIYADLRAHRSGRRPNSQWAQLWEEFQREGGQTGYRDMFATPRDRADAVEAEFKQLTEGKTKAVPRAMLNWLSDYNETFENAVRLSAYKVARERGLSRQEAASTAKNLTVNFNRKGQIALQAGALYAFFNASTQGTARLAQTLRGPAGKKIVAGGLLLGVMQAMMLAAAGMDDDEPPAFVKDRQIVIPTGEGKYVSFPMPLGLHVLPAFSRRITEWMLSGRQDTAAKAVDLLGVFADSFNPIGNAGLSLQTLAPTAVDPLAALAENKDYAGRQIAKEDRSALNPTPGHTRSKDTASWLGRQVSFYLNAVTGGTEFQKGAVSPTPDQIDFLIGEATGGVGREALKTEQTLRSVATGEDLPPYKVPLIGRFYGDTKGQASQASKFYGNLKRINGHEAEIKGRRESGQGATVAEYLRENPEARLVSLANDVEKDLARAKKRKRELIESNANPETVRIVEQRITNLMGRLNQRVDQLREQR